MPVWDDDKTSPDNYDLSKDALWLCTGHVNIIVDMFQNTKNSEYQYNWIINQPPRYPK